MPLLGGGDPGMHYWRDVHPIPVKRRSLLGFVRVVCINMKRRRVARRTVVPGLHESTGDATLADAYAL